jgi:hypothetical protein
VGSTGAPTIRTVFIKGTNISNEKSPKIAGRNTKAKIFQKGSARFETTTDLKKSA